MLKPHPGGPASSRPRTLHGQARTSRRITKGVVSALMVLNALSCDVNPEPALALSLVRSGSQNEPADFVPITERSFDRLNEDGWEDMDGGTATISIQTDSEAPRSPGSIGVVTYPAGYTAGGSSSQVAKSIRQISAKDVYLRFDLKLSRNWQGHEAGDNKIFYLTDEGTGGGGDPIYIAAFGGGSNLLELAIVNQGLGSTRFRNSMAGNRARTSAAIPRGRWATIEVLIRGNTPGVRNGEIHAWIDGTKVLDFANIAMMAPGSDGLFDNFRWEPIWGGQGTRNVVETMSQSIDHIYISGRSP